MSRSRMIVIAAMLVALPGARVAIAQTVASLKIISGDGQVACLCNENDVTALQFFQPITVQALDAHGNGVPNATITWTLIRIDVSNATLGSPTTTTDSNGMSSNSLNEIENVNQGTGTRLSLQSSIVAAANGGPTATFTETYALLDLVGASEVKSGGPLMNGQPLGQVTLSGNSGTTLPNIQIFVGVGTGNSTVQGVSIELVPPPGQTNPTITCAPFSPSPTGNPGTILTGPLTNTNPLINASCTPVLGGSGTGQFYVTVGGVSTPTSTAGGGTVNTNGTAVTLVGGTDFSALADNQEIRINGVEYVISTVTNSTALVLASSAGVQNGVSWLPFQPLFLQVFGPYTFTSAPGVPTAIKLVQGNNQVVAPAQSLGTLIAQVVDARGNAVQGVNVSWMVSPVSSAGTVVLTSTANFNTTDNNGQVSTLANFSGSAVGNITITVALAGNSAINATFTETAVVPIKSLQKISGDGQSAVVGTAFAAPLIVQVNGNASPITNYPVQFSVTGPGILSQNTALSNNIGLAQVTVTAGNATGTVTVTVSVGGLSQTFTLTAKAVGPTPTGIVKVSGDGQSVFINTLFPAPLIVQVNSTAGPVGNTPVQFSSTGPITLASNSGLTNGNGQTQVSVTSGYVTGAATVTASIPGYSVIFSLTVNPPGPTITAASFANAASGQSGFLSPCGLATITATGLAPNGAASLFPAPIFGPAPLLANGISVDFNNYFAPIFSATMVNGQPQLMVQVPCEVTPAASVPVTVNVGGSSTTVNVQVLAAAPGIFTIPYPDGVARAVALRADGSFVTLNAGHNPARLGEIVRVYVTGLGPTFPVVGTNQVDNPGADLTNNDAKATGVVTVTISGSSGVTVISARLAANLIGVFEVAFIVPADAPQGDNTVISVGVVPAGSTTAINSATTTIPIQ